MRSVIPIVCAVWACVAVPGGLPAQEPDQPRRLTAAETGCDSLLRFVVDSAGWVDRCTIALVEESSADWTAAVLQELRRARFEPARKDGRRVRQVVYQVFIYHSDGRTDVSQ